MFRSYSDHLQGAHMFLVKVTDFLLKVSNFNKEQYELLEDDLNKIETCWSVFKCFNVNILD